MDVRPVKDFELCKCFKLGHAFYELRNPGAPFVEQRFLDFWSTTLFLNRGTIIGAFDGNELKGVYGGVLVEGVYDGLITATEHFWWMPKGGMTAVRLVQVFEAWAKANGAYASYLGHFADTPKVGRIYESLGYTVLEHGYRKVL